MVEKRISIYGDLDVLSPFNGDQLYFEISESHATLIVKNGIEDKMDAFEYFEFNKKKLDWYEIFYQIRLNSKILDRSYNDTRVFYNLKEVVIVPASQFKADASESYLSVLFGETQPSIYRQDEIFSTLELYLPYRISKNLFDMVNTNLMMVSGKHCYTKILESVFRSNRGAGGPFLKVIYYHNMMTVLLLNSYKLILLQSYDFSTPDDMLYRLLNIVKQYHLKTADLQIEVSGLLDLKSKATEYLKKLFPKLSLEASLSNPLYKDFLKEYPVHYFTPFLNNLL